MKNILIVDDELPIREWIAMCINNYRNKNNVYVAKNGEDAINYVNEIKFDIIFTDITMPKIDGLQVLEYVKKNSPNTKVMIMSVHKDFEYARYAIKHGAEDYIVKNEINQDIISAILDKYLDEDPKKIGEDGKINTGKASRYINKLLTDKNTQSTIEILKENGINLCETENSSFFVFALPDILENIEHSLLIKDSILKNQTLISYGEDAILFFANIQGGPKEYIYSLFEELKNISNKNIGYSNIYTDLNYFKKAVLEAVACRSYDFYEGINVDNRYEKFTYHYLDFKYKKEAIELTYTLNNINTNDLQIKQKTNIDLKKLLEYLKLAMINDIGFVRVVLQDLVQNLCIQFNSLNLCDEISSTIESEYSFLTIEQAIYEFIDKIVLVNKYSENISNTLQFLENNYHRNISMNGVAKRLFLNEEYFSRLFKNEVGVTFTQHLNDLRMNRAKKLVLESKYKINEIGEMVGFSNSKYFSMIFKKYFGITPSKYREEKSK